MVPQWWFPREDLDADTFAFEILHNGVNEDAFPRKNGAGAWFEFWNVDRYEIQEQSFPLPNDEVLTVLAAGSDNGSDVKAVAAHSPTPKDASDGH